MTLEVSKLVKLIDNKEKHFSNIEFILTTCLVLKLFKFNEIIPEHFENIDCIFTTFDVSN